MADSLNYRRGVAVVFDYLLHCSAIEPRELGLRCSHCRCRCSHCLLTLKLRRRRQCVVASDFLDLRSLPACCAQLNHHLDCPLYRQAEAQPHLRILSRTMRLARCWLSALGHFHRRQRWGSCCCSLPSHISVVSMTPPCKRLLCRATASARTRGPFVDSCCVWPDDTPSGHRQAATIASANLLIM